MYTFDEGPYISGGPRVIPASPVTYPTVLHALEQEHVFRVDPQADGTYIVMETCDEYFYLRLTREQLRALGRELIELAEADGQKEDE